MTLYIGYVLQEHYEGSSNVDVAKIVHTCCKHGYDYIVVQYVLFIIINKYGIYFSYSYNY